MIKNFNSTGRPIAEKITAANKQTAQTMAGRFFLLEPVSGKYKIY